MIRKKQEKYGPYVIDLTGPQGNAFVLLGYAKQFARQLQFDDELKNKNPISVCPILPFSFCGKLVNLCFPCFPITFIFSYYT